MLNVITPSVSMMIVVMLRLNILGPVLMSVQGAVIKIVVILSVIMLYVI
jgi:hypothetical protein